jgi:hypothetical protein
MNLFNGTTYTNYYFFEMKTCTNYTNTHYRKNDPFTPIKYE